MSSVKAEVLVEAPPDRAFRTFTEKMGAWWPQSHHIGKVEMKDVVMEQRPNGQWFEVGTDGSRCEWGRVLIWDPPRRVVLAWQLTAQWQFDSSLVTEVEINFTPVGKSQTRVVLEHRNLERFGKDETAVRESVGSKGGWPLILDNFSKAVGQPEAAGVSSQRRG